MAIIQKEIEIAGSKGKVKENALFDSGASYSCIERSLALELGNPEGLLEPFEIATAEKGRNISVREHISLVFYLNGYRFSDEFIVIPDLSEKIIIGAKTLQAWRLKLDFENDEVIID